MTTIPVSSTGRITIPAAMRRQLGWGKGTLVQVIEQDDGSYVLQTAVTKEDKRPTATGAAAEKERS